MLQSVKQGGIKYHFKSLWYDVTRERTQVSQPIGEHSTHSTELIITKFSGIENP